MDKWYDEWEKPLYSAFDRAPPCYVLGLGFTSSCLSEEEVAEANRIRDLNERIRLDYERQCEEHHRIFPRLRLEFLQKRIDRLLRFLREPDAPRHDDLAGGYVYLMRCPKIGMHKIGHTADVTRRRAELRQSMNDKDIVVCESFPPLVSRYLLEPALHCHFRHLHHASDKSDELFELTDIEVDTFLTTAAAIERLLLPLEIMHLNARASSLTKSMELP